jgi:ribosomal protein L29
VSKCIYTGMMRSISVKRKVARSKTIICDKQNDKNENKI